MEIKNYIKIYDNILPLETLSNLLRFINTLNFDQGQIVGNVTQETNLKIRKTKVCDLFLPKESLTYMHWSSLLKYFINNMMEHYAKDLKLLHKPYSSIVDLSVLKYENSDFYTWHTDHCDSIPRTLSCILLLNNDYEGGNLCFRNPDSSNEWSVDVVPNRMIIWPSNFLYPHTVKPIKKGIRYSIVSWAL